MIQDQSVVHEASYPHPPERVWQALVDPEELALWLMPNDFLPLVGRPFTMECDPIGQIQAEVLEMDPPRRLCCRWVASFGDTVVTFELTRIPEGTQLRVEHRGWSQENTADRERFESGWTEKLADRLRRVLDRAPGASHVARRGDIRDSR
jgi:uncharacterized protein YndB with AHSA1/START domain